jgi:CTP synthase (UTP-ammonia lyase)
MKPRLAILGEFSPAFAPHAATNHAIAHACAATQLDLESFWISTSDISETLLPQTNGIWVAPGSPYKNIEKTLYAIRIARERGIPCLGTCGGFQHMIIEYARNVLGFSDAHHAEYDPCASRLFVSRLTCSLVGREMELQLKPGSCVAKLYGANSARENYYCNFGVNPEYIDLLKGGPLQIVGSDAEGEIRVIEVPGHPFFIGTLFVPQMRSTTTRPHPLVGAFVRAVSHFTGMPH